MRGISISTTTGDIEIIDRAILIIPDTRSQEIGLVLASNRGEIKEVPLIGGEYMKLINGTATGLWAANLKKQLRSLSINIDNITIENNIITIS